MNAIALPDAPAQPAPAAKERELTHADRCDSCGARAFGVAKVAWESHDDLKVTELLFCGHHFRKHRDKLAAQGATLTDLTHLIHADKPGV